MHEDVDNRVDENHFGKREDKLANDLNRTVSVEDAEDIYVEI